MATLIAKTVDTGGTKDYPTLFAAEAANYGGTAANFVTSNEYAVCTCICTNGNPDTTAITSSGQTLDATHTIDIIVGAAYRHTGFHPASGNRYRLEIGNTNALYLDVAFTSVSYLSIKHSPTANTKYTIFLNRTSQSVHACVITMAAGATTSHAGIISEAGGGTNYVTNTLIHNVTGSGSCGFKDGGGTTRLSNCTIVACAIGFSRNSGTVVVKNNIAFLNTTDYSGSFDAASVNNGYSNGSGPSGGSGAINLGVNAALVVTNYGANDFSLCENSLAQDVGADLSADTPAVTTDILGHSRPRGGIFDIGAFERSISIAEVLSDGFSIADALSSLAVAAATLADTIGVSDVPVGLATAMSVVVDGMTVADSPGGTATAVVVIFDGVETTDVLSNLAAAVAAVVDGVEVADVIALVSKGVTILVSDGVDVSDVTSGLAAALATVADGVETSDTPAGLAAALAALADLAEVSDTTSGLAAALAALADTAEASDTTSGLAAAFSVEADTVKVSDAAHRFTKQIRPDWTHPKLKRLF